MSFTYDGPNGRVSDEDMVTFDRLTIIDTFNRADGAAENHGAWVAAQGPWKTMAATVPGTCTITGTVLTTGDGRIISPFNGQPALVIPDDAVAGDTVTWEIRDGVVIAVRVNEPPTDCSED